MISVNMILFAQLTRQRIFTSSHI